MAAKTTKPWYYEAQIVRSGSGAVIDRQGIIRTQWPLDALDGIVKMAREQWKVELRGIRLYDQVHCEEIGRKALELVATTKIGEPHEGSRRPSIIHQVAKESLLEGKKEFPSQAEQLSSSPFVDRPQLPAPKEEESSSMSDKEAHWSGHTIGSVMRNQTYPLMKPK